MTLTRRQFLAGTVALPIVAVALKSSRAHEWALDGDFCERCGVPLQDVVDHKWPKICGESYRYLVEWRDGEDRDCANVIKGPRAARAVQQIADMKNLLAADA